MKSFLIWLAGLFGYKLSENDVSKPAPPITQGGGGPGDEGPSR